MKKLLLCLALLTACSSTPAELESADFGIDLSYSESEHGDDSNGESIEISVRDHQVIYTWEYWGYHPSENYEREETMKGKLSDEELEELKDSIEALGLWEAHTEEQETGYIGDSLEITLEMRDDEKTVSSHVDGMTWALETREGNIENTDYVETIDDLMDLILDYLES